MKLLHMTRAIRRVLEGAFALAAFKGHREGTIQAAPKYPEKYLPRMSPIQEGGIQDGGNCNGCREGFMLRWLSSTLVE